MQNESSSHHPTESPPTDGTPDAQANLASIAESMVSHAIVGPPSDQLYTQIKNATSFAEFWERHKKRIVHQPLSGYLCAMLDKKGLKRSDVVVKTGLDKAYVYQIFAGQKNPSRNKLLTIAFGMKLSEEETQRMLHLSGHRELWPKDERDALLLFSIQRGMSLEDVHVELERYGLDPLADPVK